MTRVPNENPPVRLVQRSALALASLAAWVAITSSLTACTKPLFPDNAYRTQYDQYDRLRGSYVEPHQTDMYGKPVPALRERLRLN